MEDKLLGNNKKIGPPVLKIDIEELKNNNNNIEGFYNPIKKRKDLKDDSLFIDDFECIVKKKYIQPILINSNINIVRVEKHYYAIEYKNHNNEKIIKNVELEDVYFEDTFDFLRIDVVVLHPITVNGKNNIFEEINHRFFMNKFLDENSNHNLKINKLNLPMDVNI